MSAVAPPRAERTSACEQRASDWFVGKSLQGRRGTAAVLAPSAQKTLSRETGSSHALRAICAQDAVHVSRNERRPCVAAVAAVAAVGSVTVRSVVSCCEKLPHVHPIRQRPAADRARHTRTAHAPSTAARRVGFRSPVRTNVEPRGDILKTIYQFMTAVLDPVLEFPTGHQL